MQDGRTLVGEGLFEFGIMGTCPRPLWGDHG